MNALRLAPRRMVKALAAGTVMVAAALPLAVATEAGAVGVPASSYLTLTPSSGVPVTVGSDGSAAIFGAGWSGAGTIYLNAADKASLANLGQTVAVTTTAAGVTFSGSSETAGTPLSVATTIASSATTTPGFYPVTITDSAGTVTVANAFYVEAAPTITSISPSSLPGNASGITVTVTGTGFVTGATGHIVNSASVSLGTLAYASPTTMTATVSTGSNTGFFGVSITNGDGATASSSTVGITVTGPTLTKISPASVAIPGASTSPATTTLTITGTNFQTGAYVLIAHTATGTNASVGTTTVVNATTLTVPLTVVTGAVADTWAVTVHNPDGSTVTLAGGIGVGKASLAAPVITAVSALPVLSASGSSASAVITGSGFGPAGSSVGVAFGTAAGPDSFVVCGSATVISDSQISCIVTVSSGALSGVHNVTVTPAGGTDSNAFSPAVTVSGPVITASSPANVPANFVGTLTLTGTGFTSGTASATIAGSVTSPTATVTATYVSATSFTVTLASTASLPAGQNLIVNLTDHSGVTTSFAIPVVNAPSISSVIYPTGYSGVGQGATNVPVTIVGSGFQPGATLSFTSSLVTGAIVTISPTAIVANISTTSAAATSAFKVTNTNGGFASSSLTVNGVTQATSSPTGFLAGVKAATLTITGAGFSTATILKASSSLITLGTATVVSTSVITVPVTVAAVTGTVVINWTLSVTNGDGGSSSIALTVNPGPTVTGVYYVPTFSTNYEVSVTGTGFEAGMTAASSNSAYTVAVANVNTTTQVVTLLVTTTSAATSGTSSNVTFTNPDGSAVTFALNGGPVPTPVKPAPKAVNVVGHVSAGKTVTIHIAGSGFYGQPTVTSHAGTVARVSGDNGKLLTVVVSVKAGSPNGMFTFTITFKNGEVTKVKYIQRP